MELTTTNWQEGLDNKLIDRCIKLATAAEHWLQSTQALAEELASVREQMQHGQWQRYCEQHMPLNIRLITDLIRMHEGLPAESKLWELNSKRAAAIAAGTDEETQQQIEDEYISTGKMTEARVNEIIKPDKKKSVTKKELEERLTATEEKLDTAIEKIDELKGRLSKADKQVASAAEAELIKMQLDDLHGFETVILKTVGKHSEFMPAKEKVKLLLSIMRMMGADGRQRGIKQLREGIKLLFGEDAVAQLDGQLPLPAPGIAGADADKIARDGSKQILSSKPEKQKLLGE
jgi:hypothetical protein